MQHPLFKPKSFSEGQHAVVGDCNGVDMATRYNEETPFFVKKILSLCNGMTILDYGCGVGRISKEILKQDPLKIVVGVDDSKDMRQQAIENVNHHHFMSFDPRALSMEAQEGFFDMAILVYVLQHIPAIEIREALQRIHYYLKDDGILFYCSSNYRMAIRFDTGAFFDDRFLGINLQEELSRYFDILGPAFTDEELNSNAVVKKMITGEDNDGRIGLAHPALILRKKKIDGNLFDAINKVGIVKEAEKKENVLKEAQKLVLVQKQSPGDILMATIALRDLHTAYPGEYLTDMRTPCNDLFKNSPYITPISPVANEEEIIKKLKTDDEHLPIKVDDVMYCNLHYPMVHQSGQLGTHFADAMTEFLSKQLGRLIPRVGLRPEIYLDFNEGNWPSPVLNQTGFSGKYWVLNAGSKSDYPLKQYPYYQAVVDAFNSTLGVKNIKIVQIGVKASDHNHKPLEGTLDMIGKTNMRELIRVLDKAEGLITCVSVPMHLAAALKKPCVVIAGGREGTRWELYPDHRFLYTNGALNCCRYDGCWKSTLEECVDKENGIPHCMELIRPSDIVNAVSMYYKGGVL